MGVALTREISPAFNACELTHVARVPIDLDRARAQHRDYEARLVEAGCRVQRLAAGAHLPDSVFIEDTAVVFDEIAIVARPGAVSRRAETEAVAEALRPYRTLVHIESPGTLDGGDVLCSGRRVFVGRSSRTNDGGVAQLRRALAPYAYEVAVVSVRGALHLKSAVTAVAPDLLLMNPGWVSRELFAPFEILEVDPREPGAANALRVGTRVIFPTAFPRTRERLEARGLKLLTVDASEVAKAEGAVTCCSLVFDVPR
jgi:dimethylargininase